MKKDSRDQGQAAPKILKKPYQPPRVFVLGEVENKTLGPGGQMVIDGASGMGMFS